MPTPEEIIQGLTYAANQYAFLAWVWHFLFLLLAILLIAGRRPSKRILAIILALPLASVGIVALSSSNPFNAIVFLVAAILLMIIGYRLPEEQIRIKPNVLAVLGIFMIIYGWVYPHFIEADYFFEYLYASPVGLVPCPTLSMVIGFTLLFGGFGSKKWMLPLAVLGLFYGFVGVFRLEVKLDLGLLMGAIALAIFAMVIKNKRV